MSKSSRINVGTIYVPAGIGGSPERIAEVLARYKINERAIEAGQKNEPRTGDTHPDETQRQLIDQSLGFVGTATRLAGEQITERVNRIRLITPSMLNTRTARSAINRRVVEEKDRYRDDLLLAFEDRERAVRDLRGFEETNRLAPFSAVYKDDLLLSSSSVIAIALSEAVFNAFILQDLQANGLIGGLALALGVGVANVLMGVGTGLLGWRLLIHLKPLRRFLGIGITALFMSAAFALHLALGDLREAITHNPTAQIDFLVILKPWRWFNYTSIPPFVLFAVGVATFLIAALKGRGGTWGVVSPYWGHDTLDRRFRAAEAVLQDAKQNLKAAVQNAFDEERARLRAEHAAQCQAMAEIRQLAAAAQGIKRTLGDSIEAEIGRLHIWLRMYRDRNRAVRRTPAPDYFETYPGFEEWRTDRLDLSTLMDLVAAAERQLGENGEKLAVLEDETLREQVAVIETMLETITESERTSVARIARDDAAAAPKAA